MEETSSAIALLAGLNKECDRIVRPIVSNDVQLRVLLLPNRVGSDEMDVKCTGSAGPPASRVTSLVCSLTCCLHRGHPHCARRAQVSADRHGSSIPDGLTGAKGRDAGVFKASSTGASMSKPAQAASL